MQGETYSHSSIHLTPQPTYLLPQTRTHARTHIHTRTHKHTLSLSLSLSLSPPLSLLHTFLPDRSRIFRSNHTLCIPERVCVRVKICNIRQEQNNNGTDTHSGTHKHINSRGDMRKRKGAKKRHIGELLLRVSFFQKKETLCAATQQQLTNYSHDSKVCCY